MHANLVASGVDLLRHNPRQDLYAEQCRIAIDIVAGFAKSRHVVLAYHMQAGKTGIITAVLNALRGTRFDTNVPGAPLDPGAHLNIKKVLVLTGGDFRDLKEQTSADIEGFVRNGKDVQVRKQSDMKPEKLAGTRDTLIVVDESHYGTDKDGNVLIKGLKEVGASMNTENLCANNNYVLSVSATANVEMLSDGDCAKHYVTPDAPDGYTGVKWFSENDRISGPDDEDRLDFVVDAVEDAILRIEADDDGVSGHGSGILIIREDSSNRPRVTEELLRDRLSHHGGRIEWMSINAKAKGGKIDYEELVDLVPNCATPGFVKTVYCLLIKGAYRMGMRISNYDGKLMEARGLSPKDYIYLCVDVSDGVMTTAQGLLGRMCGYNRKHPERNRFVCNVQAVEKYLKGVEACERFSRGEIELKEMLDSQPGANAKTKTGPSEDLEYEKTTTEYGPDDFGPEIAGMIERWVISPDDRNNPMTSIIEKIADSLFNDTYSIGIVDVRSIDAQSTIKTVEADKQITLSSTLTRTRERGNVGKWVRTSLEKRIEQERKLKLDVLILCRITKDGRKVFITTGRAVGWKQNKKIAKTKDTNGVANSPDYESKDTNTKGHRIQLKQKTFGELTT